MDSIIIDADLLCNVGITPQERSERQKISVFLELVLDLRKAAKSGSIYDTIDYSALHSKIKKICSKKFTLIETLAEEIAKQALSSKAKKVKVRISKYQGSTKYSVEIEREHG